MHTKYDRLFGFFIGVATCLVALFIVGVFDKAPSIQPQQIVKEVPVISEADYQRLAELIKDCSLDACKSCDAQSKALVLAVKNEFLALENAKKKYGKIMSDKKARAEKIRTDKHYKASTDEDAIVAEAMNTLQWLDPNTFINYLIIEKRSHVNVGYQYSMALLDFQEGANSLALSNFLKQKKTAEETRNRLWKEYDQTNRDEKKKYEEEYNSAVLPFQEKYDQAVKIARVKLGLTTE